MALLGCRTAGDVYEVAADFMLLLAPGAVVIVNEASPDLEWLTTRAIRGMDESLLAKAADLVGFEIIGKRSAILPIHRDEMLGGTLSTIPGGFAELASSTIPRRLAQAGARMFALHDVFSIGIADRESVLGNIQIYTRAAHVVLPTHIIESFAHHCFSALAAISRAQEIARHAESTSLLLRSMVEGLALHQIILDESGQPCDYRFLDVNPAFESMTGLKGEDIIGHTVREVLPGLDPSWIQRYGTVALTGVSARFEDYVPELGRYYEIAAYSPQPGRFASVVSDVTERRRIERELADEQKRSTEHLARSLSSIVEIVSQVAETRDPYTAGHQRRVSELAVRVSEEMGMSAHQIEETRIAALLHDIGKMSVPAEILSRPGTLSPLEFELIKVHAEAGYKIIASAAMEGQIAEIVYQHHERCDGSGYPRGIGDGELLPEAKVLMVADVVEAMVSHRPYRPGLGTEAALAEIEQGAGSRYDAQVAASCQRVFRDLGFAFPGE